MRKIFLLVVALSTSVAAQSPPTSISYEVVTFDNTAGGVGLSAATLTVQGQQVRVCSGVLEDAAIRFRVDGVSAPSAADATPLAVGQFVRIEGFANLTKFRGIRVTGTDGIIRFTCSR